MTESESPVAGLSIFDICETDTSAEEQGRWFRDIFDTTDNPVDVKLRRLTSKESLKVRRRLEKGYRKFYVKGKLSEDKELEMFHKQLAEAVIVDWKGVNDRSGEPIPYNSEIAFELLSKLSAFRDAVSSLANSLDNFRVEEVKDGVKN